MPKILLDNELYENTEFKDERELERVVVEHSDDIFGEKTIYFDVKREVMRKKGELSARAEDVLVLSGKG